MNTQTKKLFSASLVVITLFAITGATLTIIPIQQVLAADSTYTLLEPLPDVMNSGATPQPEVNLTTYIKDAINLLIALSAVAAVFMIVWGGLQYMTTDSWGGKSAGIEKLWNAVIGLLMVLSTYLILHTINPKLVDIATIPTLTGLQTSSPQSLIDQLTAETDSLNSIANGSYDKAKSALATVAALNNKLNTAQQNYAINCVGGWLNDQTCDQANKEIADLKNQIASTTASVIVNNQSAITTNSLAAATNVLGGDTTKEAISNDVTTIKSSIDATTAEKLAQLESLGSTEEKIAVINQGLYSKAYVDIQAEIAKVNVATSLSWYQSLKYGDTVTGAAQQQKDSSLKEISSIIAKYSAQPNVNQTMLQQLKDKQTSANQTINGAAYHF